MTQVKTTQSSRTQVASKLRGRPRTLAQQRADLEAQMRASMGLLSENELPAVSKRLKGLRKELARKDGRRVPQYEVAHDLKVPPRTFQSWENGEVETDGQNYGRIARYYARKLRRPVSRNYILYGRDEAPSAPVASPTMQGNGNGNGRASELAELRAEVAGLRRDVDRILEQQVQGLSVLDEVRAVQAQVLELLRQDGNSSAESGTE